MQTEEEPAGNAQPVPSVPIEEDEEEEVDTSTAPEGAKITDYDCNQRCENRKNNDTYQYCRELCGLNEGSAPKDDGPIDTKDCFKLTGIQKDICLKREAIEKKNDSICDDIEDQQLRENCINRVAEEILE